MSARAQPRRGGGVVFVSCVAFAFAFVVGGAWVARFASAAEPAALLWRAPSDQAVVAIDSAGVSLDTTFELGLASPLTLDVALAFDAPADSVAVFVGHQRQLWGEDRGLFVRGVVASGVVLPLIAAGVGVGLDVAAICGWRGTRSEVALGLVVPAIVAWQDGAAWRLPARLEAIVRTGLGPMTLGLRVGGGLLWGGPGGAAVDVRVGVVVGWGRTSSADDDVVATAPPVSLAPAATQAGAPDPAPAGDESGPDA